MTSGSRSSPAITSAGSPGNRCCNEKIRIDTKSSVGISCKIRLPRKFSMGRGLDPKPVHLSSIYASSSIHDLNRDEVAIRVVVPALSRDPEPLASRWDKGVCRIASKEMTPRMGPGSRSPSRLAGATRFFLLPSLEFQPDHALQPVRYLLVTFTIGGGGDPGRPLTA